MKASMLKAAVLAGLAGAWICTASQADADSPWGSPELVDPAYNRYVDMHTVGHALRQGDADALVDCALQLAEGERVLLRPHRALKQGELLAAALRAAVESHDAEALERLSRVAASRKNEKLAAQVEQASKLADAARDPHSELTVPVRECTPQQYAEIHQCYSDARLAKITGDARSLESWDPDRLDRLPDPIRPRLEQLLKETRDGLSDAEQGGTILGRIARQTGTPGETEPVDIPSQVSGSF
jgi:hypothetical protein